MGSSILKLYPQFGESKDRRQDDFAVSFERRSVDDRRQGQRLSDPKLGDDISKVQDTFKVFIRKDEQNPVKKDNKSTKNFLAVLSPIIPVRRLSSLPDNLEEHNYVRAAGLVALAAANFPEDWRDISAGYKQIFKGIKPDYDYKNYQHSFSFFRGTFLEPLLRIKGKFGEKLSNFLYRADKSLDDTKFGKFLSKTLKFKIDYDDTELIKRVTKSEEIKFIRAYKIKGNFLGKLVGRSLLRIPLLSIIALSLLEIPKITKTFLDKNSENRLTAGSKQIAKSGVYITSVLSNIGIFGALFARLGPAGSLIGMGIGSVAGSKLSHGINDLIDSK